EPLVGFSGSAKCLVLSPVTRKSRFNSNLNPWRLSSFRIILFQRLSIYGTGDVRWTINYYTL
ncbi:hypothetical protein IFM61606_10024, partial [Aspergillus udagawae]